MRKRMKGIAALLMATALAAMSSCGQAGNSASATTAAAKETKDAGGGDMFVTSQGETDSPDWVKNLDEAKEEDASQLFIVAGMGVNKTTAAISMHEKNENGEWKQILSTPGFVGRNGLCPDEEHMEGCGQTPMGRYTFNRAFGIADDPGCAIPYQKADDDTYWSGDMRDGMKYNEMVDIKDYPDLDKENSEHIVDYQYQYQYCLNISFNEDGTPGRGSAIFLHSFGPENPYTGGCVAVPEYTMKTIMQRVKPDCTVIIDTRDHLMEKSDPEVAKSDVKLSGDSSDFVLLSDVIPDAILEIRYYSTYNFIGDRVDGYEEPLAFLTKEAAFALREVSDELVKKGYRLKIYDAYRPQKAVTNFVNWSMEEKDTRMKSFFYPDLDKSVLFPQGYIDRHSGHSRGSTVDLTLFDMKTEKEVDMGGTFDFFGELSHPDYKEITAKQYENRMILREAMLNHGFKPLAEEWWHFTLENEPYPDTYFTFPVSSESVPTVSAAWLKKAEEAHLSGTGPEEIKEKGVLKVGTTGDYKPMSYKDAKTGTYWGMDVELIEDFAKDLGVKIEYVPTTWPTLMEDTLAGKFDLAICGITVNDARKEKALMSKGYIGNGKTVLCRAEDAKKYTSLEAINQPGVTVMENPGGLNEKFAKENLPKAKLIIHEVNEEIPGLIAEGKADVMITEIAEAGYYVGQDSRLAAPLIHKPFTRGEIGILLPKGYEKLTYYVNEFLDKENKNGRIEDLANEYIYKYINADSKNETSKTAETSAEPAETAAQKKAA